MANPSTRQRVEEVTRERKALARLIELATSNSNGTDSSKRGGRTKAGAKAAEKATDEAETSDTEEHAPAAQAPIEEEERGTA